MTIDNVGALAGLMSLGVTALVAYLLVVVKAQISPILVELRQIHELLRDRRRGEIALFEKMADVTQRVTRIEARMDVCSACRTATNQTEKPRCGTGS